MKTPSLPIINSALLVFAVGAALAILVVFFAEPLAGALSESFDRAVTGLRP